MTAGLGALCCLLAVGAAALGVMAIAGRAERRRRAHRWLRRGPQ